MKEKFASYEGKIVFRLIAYKDNTYDIENGLMQRLNPAKLLAHDEAMAFIHQYSLDNQLGTTQYTLIEQS